LPPLLLTNPRGSAEHDDTKIRRPVRAEILATRARAGQGRFPRHFSDFFALDARSLPRASVPSILNCAKRFNACAYINHHGVHFPNSS
jgi:hypothetical protein